MNLKVQLLATYTNICKGSALALGGYIEIHCGLCLLSGDTFWKTKSHVDVLALITDYKKHKG